MAFTRGYRRTVLALAWVPVVLMVAAGVLSVALLAYADGDPSSNSGAGYLTLFVLVGGPLLLGAFVPEGIVLSCSEQARAVRSRKVPAAPVTSVRSGS